METKEEKQLKLDKRYIRMASIWAENSYCERRQVGALIVKDKMIILSFTINAPTDITELLQDSKMYAKMTTESPSLTYYTLKRMLSPK